DDAGRASVSALRPSGRILAPAGNESSGKSRPESQAGRGANLAFPCGRGGTLGYRPDSAPGRAAPVAEHAWRMKRRAPGGEAGPPMFVLALSRQDELSRLEMPVGGQAHEVDSRALHPAAIVATVPLGDGAPGAPEPG